MDQAVAARVSSTDEEAAPDLARAREDAPSDDAHPASTVETAKTGHLVVWGAAWMGRHEVRLRKQHFDRVGLQLAFDADLPGDADGIGAAGSVGQDHGGDDRGQVSSPRCSASCASGVSTLTGSAFGGGGR